MATAKKTTASKEGKPTGQADEMIKKFSHLYPVHDTKWIPTGSLAMDYLLGNGLPMGKTVSFFSGYAVGKTTTVLHLVKAVLDADPENVVLYIDAERALDESLKLSILGEDYKKKYGKRFGHFRTSIYEQVEDLLVEFMGTRSLKLVVIDSETNLKTQAQSDGEDRRIGTKAGYQSVFCPRMKDMTDIGRFTVLYVAQERANIVTTGRADSLTKSAGGHSFHHNNDIELNLKVRSKIYDGVKNTVGAVVRVTSKKNRVAGNKSAFMILKYGYGISNIATLVSVLKWSGLVKQGGAYFTLTHPKINAGEGVGKPTKAQGNSGLETLVTEHFGHIVDVLRSEGTIKKYFEEFTM